MKGFGSMAITIVSAGGTIDLIDAPLSILLQYHALRHTGLWPRTGGTSTGEGGCRLRAAAEFMNSSQMCAALQIAGSSAAA